MCEGLPGRQRNFQIFNSRWDLQRLREETQLQRLRARQEKQILSINQLKREDTPSILPNLEVGPVCLQDSVLVYINVSLCRR